MHLLGEIAMGRQEVGMLSGHWVRRRLPGVVFKKNFSKNRKRVQGRKSPSKINRLYLLDIYSALDIILSVWGIRMRQTHKWICFYCTVRTKIEGLQHRTCNERTTVPNIGIWKKLVAIL